MLMTIENDGVETARPGALVPLVAGRRARHFVALRLQAIDDADCKGILVFNK